MNRRVIDKKEKKREKEKRKDTKENQNIIGKNEVPGWNFYFVP